MNRKRQFTVLIEQDEVGYLVATVPSLQGCHTKAKTLDTMRKRLRKGIALWLEEQGDPSGVLELVGAQQATV